MTKREYSYRKDLALDLVQDYNHSRVTGYYLEEIEQKLKNYSNDEQYYVLMNGFANGKIGISTTLVNNKYDIVITYAIRKKYRIGIIRRRHHEKSSFNSRSKSMMNDRRSKLRRLHNKNDKRNNEYYTSNTPKPKRRDGESRF